MGCRYDFIYKLIFIYHILRESYSHTISHRAVIAIPNSQKKKLEK